jgi:SAM-dependent methyltransferase
MDENTIKLTVRDHYGKIAVKNDCGCGPGCCSSDTVEVVPLIDYGSLDVPVMPEANLGLGCGLPTGFAAIQEGETVLDLGSGAGVDVFIAARQVGPAGKVIGVDMTPEMIWRARQNALQGGYSNVDFRLGEIEAMPVEPDSVDIVISNCVVNLVPDKRRAFGEIYRVLKTGGRIAISDVVSYGQIPAAIRQDAEAWAGCISGAVDQDEYLEIIRAAGLSNVRIAQKVDYDAYKNDGYGFASVTVLGEKI